MIDWLKDLFNQPYDMGIKILISLLIIIILLVVRKSIIKLVARWRDDPKVLYNWREITTYVTFFIGLIFLINIWFEKFESMGTFLGIFSAGLAIALKDPLVNLAGWAFIIVRRPFQVGDRIELGEYRGDVIDIRIFQFTLNEIGNWVDADQSTGRIIHIPNGKVFTEMQANYTRGFKFIWNEIPIVITFESDWEKAKEILLEVVNKNTKHLSKPAEERLKEAAQRFMIFYTNLTPIVYTTVKDHGVCLTLRYLCNPRERRSSENLIWENVLVEFAKYPYIDFAYPTQRFYDRTKEGIPDQNDPGEKDNKDE